MSIASSAAINIQSHYPQELPKAMRHLRFSEAEALKT